jgi:hypothetical protein
MHVSLVDTFGRPSQRLPRVQLVILISYIVTSGHHQSLVSRDLNTTWSFLMIARITCGRFHYA